MSGRQLGKHCADGRLAAFQPVNRVEHWPQAVGFAGFTFSQVQNMKDAQAGVIEHLEIV